MPKSLDLVRAARLLVAAHADEAALLEGAPPAFEWQVNGA